MLIDRYPQEFIQRLGISGLESSQMNKPKINTDQVITDIKKTLYELRDVNFDAMTDEERAAFRAGFEESETLAHSILGKIAAIKGKDPKES